MIIGWSIYTLCYLFDYLPGTTDDNVLNLLYYLTDMLNKTWRYLLNTVVMLAFRYLGEQFIYNP